ncbi:WD40/YVTN/BNR-like repeat-containing protein [Sphingobacterium sp. LRF_L2]|uniref:WD40/YVTN/BNR-like repeat-containing protein n=1 Tax=Sphingobacterium sp. LRF_L2 TaxID=3369421 RepID=UPI003F606EE0
MKLFPLLLVLFSTFLQAKLSIAQKIEILTQLDHTSFRGVQVYKNNCIWVSGNNGTVGKSTDKGHTWSWVSPKGYEKYDFRDIEILSEKEVIIVSAGSPAVVLKTINGGLSWKEVYRDDRPEIFLDGVSFRGSEGFIIGDPIDGLFQLLQSKDRGNTWTDVSNFMFLIADNEEAVFAASGTSIQYLNNNLWIGTGGASANIFKRNEKARTMDKYPCPILQGKSSQGIFSIDFLNDNIGIVVGGDYLNDKNVENTVLLTFDGGKNWENPTKSTNGFKSSVKYINSKVLIATGTSGTDISTDGGNQWNNISLLSFNSLATAKNRSEVYLVGSDGSIGKLSLAKK